MHWQYRTILFEFQKDSLLGDKYIDDEELETTLNEQGQSGWELVAVTPVREGILSFFKRMHQQAEPKVKPPAKGTGNQAPGGGKQTVVTAEQLQREEKEHIRRLEQERREAMLRQEQDLIGEIKIR
ncbi:hypothetical protein BMS3Bbin14_01552 [bacterium BMS3Bbin14]|nr:hypothetical protein BMS3Abin13_00016 [bacterium BMS3Abin13]GBE53070.1 hypothetical protein BMS3Bbin14_01552 [bacterium BMS3Bbin14]